MDKNLMWMIIGFVGQGFFSARFIVQWIMSEIKKQSIIPIGFWYFSLLGGVTLFAYALYKEDPVFIVGQGAGLLIYSRNLYLIRKRSKTDKS
ncbi:lipid-A-disaccharide synthase N-terminal domain-containing protein [Alphaproteobacteria bacterium]|mgnify:FL=1|jgi:lipid-A-disaccharide synthase-like uncharacterized protein|nr:lipid-A-disaccharide synthase N-terminal domain-containing protein [Alphaproteobacteria bacterium]|tara:strand:+ start:140 stop:415 length:276 start_codon:yes stop_codon:yes gene_type:complete